MMTWYALLARSRNYYETLTGTIHFMFSFKRLSHKTFVKYQRWLDFQEANQETLVQDDLISNDFFVKQGKEQRVNNEENDAGENIAGRKLLPLRLNLMHQLYPMKQISLNIQADNALAQLMGACSAFPEDLSIQAPHTNG